MLTCSRVSQDSWTRFIKGGEYEKLVAPAKGVKSLYEFGAASTKAASESSASSSDGSGSPTAGSGGKAAANDAPPSYDSLMGGGKN